MVKNSLIPLTAYTLEKNHQTFPSNLPKSSFNLHIRSYHKGKFSRTAEQLRRLILRLHFPIHNKPLCCSNSAPTERWYLKYVSTPMKNNVFRTCYYQSLIKFFFVVGFFPRDRLSPRIVSLFRLFHKSTNFSLSSYKIHFKFSSFFQPLSLLYSSLFAAPPFHFCSRNYFFLSRENYAPFWTCRLWQLVYQRKFTLLRCFVFHFVCSKYLYSIFSSQTCFSFYLFYRINTYVGVNYYFR